MAGLVLSACTHSKGPRNGAGVGLGAADEALAAEAGRAALAAGGSAADAAVAMGLTLAVTLPSRAGLGGGGVCVVHDPRTKAVRTLDFLPRSGAGGRSGAAVPGMLRGLSMLHAGHGRLRWEQVVVAAELLAREDTPVSRALAQDYQTAGKPAGAGQPLSQPDLAGVLAQVRQKGVGVFYDGTLAGTVASGLGLDAAVLRAYRPQWRDTVVVPVGHEEFHFARLSEGADSLTATLWRAAADRPAAEWPGRTTAVPAETVGRGPAMVPNAGLAVVDSSEQAVACTFTLGGPFGSGRVIPGTGILAALDADNGAGIGGPALLVNPHLNWSLFAGAGTAVAVAGPTIIPAAPAALVVSALHAVAGQRPAAEAVAAVAAGPGHAHIVACTVNRAEGSKQCAPATDSRGFGVTFTTGN